MSKGPITITNRADRNFPIVCVGGSAGGLDAYTRLLKHLPADLGVAIVIVNHLRIVATHLHEILPRYAEMPVELIAEGVNIEPNRVFIIPLLYSQQRSFREISMPPAGDSQGRASLDQISVDQ